MSTTCLPFFNPSSETLSTFAADSGKPFLPPKVQMENILDGVGKKTRASYLAGNISEAEITRLYNCNKKEAEAFNPFGLNIFEFKAIYNETHNPLLRTKINLLIEECKNKSRCSNSQNKISLMKLDYYMTTALGLGLRSVINGLHKIARTTNNVEAKILHLLMQIEFANLVAKKRHDKKQYCYERKDLLLMQLSDLLYDNGWKCGLSYSTGKTASYLVFVYLPNGEQVSWHCNNYHMVDYYYEEAFSWDGLACSTLEKLLTYAHEKFGIGKALNKFRVVL